MPANFKYKGKSIFLTYSQCGVSREALLAVLKDKVGNDTTNQLSKACIGQEHHEDGGLHLHACAWYTHTLRFCDVRYLDITDEEGKVHHPNVKGNKVQNKKRALDYCSKEDPEPLQYNMDIKAETAAREGHRKIIGKRLLDGEPLHTVVEDCPELIYDYLKLEQNLAAYKRQKAEDKPDLPEMIPNTFDLALPFMPEEKRRHYWFWSQSPDRGKTTFLESLEQSYRAHFYTKSEKYQSFPTNTQIVLIDEFSDPFLTVTTLNQMCDGTYKYPTKGGQAIKLSKPLIVCCSNKPPSALYPNTYQYLLARFQFINLDPKPETKVEDC